jgi:hypothetical protein
MVRASTKCMLLAVGPSNSKGSVAIIAMRFGRCVSFLAVVAAVFGQETVPFDSDLVIRSTTNLVQVRVVAEDSQGRPVADLQRADFQIQDDRKPQPITLFAADRGPRLPPTAASSSADSVEAPAGYSVILLDWLNIKYSYRLQAQEQVIGLLKKYQPRERVAIYILDHDPRYRTLNTSEAMPPVSVPVSTIVLSTAAASVPRAFPCAVSAAFAS